MPVLSIEGGRGKSKAGWGLWRMRALVGRERSGERGGSDRTTLLQQAFSPSSPYQAMVEMTMICILYPPVPVYSTPHVTKCSSSHITCPSLSISHHPLPIIIFPHCLWLVQSKYQLFSLIWKKFKHFHFSSENVRSINLVWFCPPCIKIKFPPQFEFFALLHTQLGIQARPDPKIN